MNHAKNQFGEPLVRPRKPKDLILVVDGINHMSTQVEQAFKNQAKEAQKLRERAYIGPVSQLGNRAYYMSQLTPMVRRSQVWVVLAVLKAEFIGEEYDEKSCTKEGDALVRNWLNSYRHQFHRQISPSLVFRVTSLLHYAKHRRNELKLVASSITMACIQNLGSDQPVWQTTHCA